MFTHRDGKTDTNATYICNATELLHGQHSSAQPFNKYIYYLPINLQLCSNH